MGLLDRFRAKVHWTIRNDEDFNAMNPGQYKIVFTSNPLSHDLFERLAGRFVKQAFGDGQTFKPKVGDSYSLPKEVIEKSQFGLDWGIPKAKAKVRVRKGKVVEVTYSLCKDGWVITQGVVGKVV